MSGSTEGDLSSYDEIVAVLDALPILVREKRRRDRMSLRAAGDAAGVGFNTLARIEGGEKHCSLPNAISVLRWLGATSQGDQP